MPNSRLEIVVISGGNPFLDLGGRQSGPRYFRFEPKKIQIFRKNFSFSRQKFLTTFCLVLNSIFFKIRFKFAFLRKYSPLTPASSLFLIKRRSLANVSYKKMFPPTHPGLTPLVV